VADAGAATWGNGTTGVTGAVSSANSLVGLLQNGAGFLFVFRDDVNDHFYARMSNEGKVRVGLQSGPAASAEIDVRGNDLVITPGDSTPSPADGTDFGNVPVLNGTDTHSFTIANAGDADLSLTGTPTIAISGDAAADFDVTSEPDAIIAAGDESSFEITFAPTLPGVRTATVTIANSAPATPSYSFTITGFGSAVKLEPQTITFAPPATLFQAQSPLTLSATASSGLPVTLSLVSGPATLVGNTLTATGVGTVRVRATQLGNGEYAAAAAVTRSIAVRANPTALTLLNLTQTYDGNPKPISTLGAASPVITYRIGTVEGPTAPTNAGRYAVKAVAGSVTKTGTLVIGRAALTITPDNKQKFLGFANPPLTYTVSGLRGSDTVAVITKAPVLTTTATTASPLGIYPIRASGAAALNYTFNYQLGALVVDSFAGSYEALLLDGSSLPVGKLSITVPSSGRTFTGRLSVATETTALSIKGSLTTNPLTELATGSATVTRNTIPYVVNFTLPPYGDVLASVTRSAAPLGSATTGRKLLMLPKGVKANYAGNHTVMLEPAVPAGSVVPTGAGWATATVAPTGTMALAGRLADGTPFTASLPADVDANPVYRLWVQPYKAARTESYLGGSFTLAPHPNPAANPGLVNRRHVAEADLTWKKTGLPADATHRTTFGPVSTVMVLDPWLAPQRASRTLPAITLASRLGMTGTTINVSHSATGSAANGNLPSVLALSATNAITVTTPAANATLTKWKVLTLDLRTGRFTGSFELLDGTRKRPATFSGILRQPYLNAVTDPVIGDGHYIVPPLTGTEKLTGEVLFQR
jgi:hypothetical protein